MNLLLHVYSCQYRNVNFFFFLCNKDEINAFCRAWNTESQNVVNKGEDIVQYIVLFFYYGLKNKVFK